MKLSIIIPYFNTWIYTDELLSVLDPQIVKGVEVILVDDGSTDGSTDGSAHRGTDRSTHRETDRNTCGNADGRTGTHTGPDSRSSGHQRAGDRGAGGKTHYDGGRN